MADAPAAAAPAAAPATRRALLGGGAALAGAALLGGCAVAPRQPAGPPADADLALIDRVTWGIDSASLRQYQQRSRRDYLRAQLHPPAGAPLPAAVQAQIDALTLQQKPMAVWAVEMDRQRRDADTASDAAGGDEAARKAARQAYQQAMNGLARDAATQMLLRALYSPNQLQEQLTWFWFNHFNVHQQKADLRLMVGDYEGRLRGLSLGRFRDLLIASATHAAMIRYLDNAQNAARRLNENYAREVMELHTLGVDGGYSQQDVQELARVLTGLGVNLRDPPELKPALQPLYVRQGLTEFNPARHDMGDKTVLGQRVAGRGWDEIVEQLTRLARHPATARHVSRQLAVYLVADDPPPALVDRMSQAFTRSEGDIAVTLQAMFDAPEFAPSLRRKFKDPVHYVVSAVRLAHDGRTIANAAPMLGWLNRLGEGPYNRQTPDGYPMDAPAWSSSGQMGTRFEIARTIGAGAVELFRPDTGATDAASLVAQRAAAQPTLRSGLYAGPLAHTLSERTQAALGGASSTTEWNALLLSSPEFMFR